MGMLVHPTGGQYSNENKAKKRLTGTLSLTGIRHGKNLMANLDPPPDCQKLNAPAPLAGDTRADTKGWQANGDCDFIHNVEGTQ